LHDAEHSPTAARENLAADRIVSFKLAHDGRSVIVGHDTGRVVLDDRWIEPGPQHERPGIAVRGRIPA